MMGEFTADLDRDRGPCPACGTDWRDGPIPEEYRQAGLYGPPGSAPTHYSRLIGVELPYDHPQRYDGVSYWLCPDCGIAWDRWTGVRTVIPSAGGVSDD